MGAALAFLRDLRTEKAVAEICGISAAAWSLYESGVQSLPALHARPRRKGRGALAQHVIHVVDHVVGGEDYLRRQVAQRDVEHGRAGVQRGEAGDVRRSGGGFGRSVRRAAERIGSEITAAMRGGLWVKPRLLEWRQA